MILAPDFAAAGRFLELIAPGGLITFQTFDDTKAARTGMARVFHGTLDQHAVELTKLNRAGAGIFFMVNQGDGTVLEGARSCRTAKNVIRVRANFVDLDGASLQPLLDAAIPPHVVVESSQGKYHAYWRISNCDLTAFEATQKALSRAFSGDPKVSDLPRVLRVPGFWHQKAEPFMSRIIIPQELA